uniref:Ditrans,polycis-polyprenyl diphosphate synthase ((2E,6E)-farnesyldiphosphate specific) n=1 Tax=Romanomermis culicivorax TaxID=13658 RepID=A0A915KVY1_ROMCU
MALTTMNIYELLRYLLSLIFSLILLVKSLLLKFYDFKRKFEHNLSLSIRRLLPRPKKIKLDVIPRHLSFILGEENVSLESVCKLVEYCRRYNVNNVTIYSPYGQQFESEDKLETLIIKLRRTVSDRVDLRVNRRKIDGFDDCIPTDRQILNVYLLNNKAGRHAIIEAAKEICKSAFLSTYGTYITTKISISQGFDKDVDEFRFVKSWALVD